MDKNKSIETLQFFVTHLAEGAIVHKQQGMIFKSQGITKLGQKYIGHFNEEMGWVEKFTERILDLGGAVKFEGMKSRDLICDPIEYVTLWSLSFLGRKYGCKVLLLFHPRNLGCSSWWG